VHSVVTQEVIASYAEKLNVQAVCQRAASGQLLFLGLNSSTGLGRRAATLRAIAPGASRLEGLGAQHPPAPSLALEAIAFNEKKALEIIF
jgi:hypothetical protein